MLKLGLSCLATNETDWAEIGDCRGPLGVSDRVSVDVADGSSIESRKLASSKGLASLRSNFDDPRGFLLLVVGALRAAESDSLISTYPGVCLLKLCRVKCICVSQLERTDE
jgi:hypothetical protein